MILRRQNITPDGWKRWLKWFEKRGEVFLSSSYVDKESDPEAEWILEFQGADSLMAAPIMVEEKIIGFLCVINPRQNTADLLFLSVVSSICYREASSRRREDAHRFGKKYISGTDLSR